MASCLGISVGKNLIKYAKMSKDKNSITTSIEAYGVKFYDVLAQTLTEIIQETKSTDADISVCITSEFYQNAECLKTMKKKEKSAWLQSQFEEACSKKGINAGNYDVRFLFAENIEDPSSDKVMCVGASKVELMNFWQALQNYRFTSISAIGPTITNLLKDKGVAENCLIVNIEDETKLTLVKMGIVSELISIPVGMDEVITQLADRYNSYAKAYEACKGIDAYSVSDASLDTEGSVIKDALMPTLYDLKTRIIEAIEPLQDDFQQVYITGTGIIVNNIDLYLSEAFKGKKVEILIPYFVNKERNSIKDVLEVNSALACANYTLSGIDKEEDFLASGTYLRAEKNKKMFSPKVIYANVREKIDEVNKKTLKVRKSSKKKKKNIEFDSEVENLEQLGGAGEFNAAPGEDEDVEYYDPMAEWFTRVSISLFVAFIAYTFVVFSIETNINSKIKTIDKNKEKTELAIKQVQSDTDTINKKAEEYRAKVVDLERVIGLAKLRRERSYSVPNFMSQLMFIIPVDVRVSSVKIGTTNTVILEASSGRYAQLGYFVSRLKLSGILKDVDMEVIDMSSDIKIKVNGVLPWLENFYY